MRIRSLLIAGLSVVLVAGCGAGNDALIPPEDADTLSTLVAEAGSQSDAGECDSARRSVREAELQLAELPRQTSRRLKQNLREWLDHLDGQIADECSAEPEPTPTAEPTVEETPTAEPTPEETPTAEPTPEETPTAEPTPEETPTVDPGTGGAGGSEEPPATGGVPPGEDG